MGQTSSTQFPYDVGKIVPSFEGHPYWTLHEGTKLENGSPVSVFAFDVKKHSEAEGRAARNAFKRMKTIRFPSVLRYLDGVELESTIYIVTDSVTPLSEALPTLHDKPEVLIWGLYQVLRALSFINIDCNMIHASFSPKSIFVNKAGDWLLGGLDLVCDTSNIEVIQANSDLIPEVYKSPEYFKKAWSAFTEASWAVDSWSLGCLIYEIFNGPLGKSSELKNIGRIPPKLVSLYQQLLTQTPKSRLPCNKVLESEFFKTQLVEVNLFLENLALKDSQEKEAFFKKLPQFLESMSEPMLKYKIMPILVQALQYGTGMNTKVLASLLKIGEHLTEEEYQTNIVPCVTKLFSCNDRAIRIHLLQSLDSYYEHLPVGLVNDQIFPQMLNGFTDTSAALRDLTIKSMVLIVPKLREKEVNTQVLKFFAQMQMDQEPGIRTNTTICLGKIAPHLSVPTQQKVLIPAFSRALKDPFPHARNASIMAFAATIDVYSIEDIAQRILPIFCQHTIDPDANVRSVCFQTINVFLEKLEQHSKKMELAQQQSEASANQAGSMGSNSSPAVMNAATNATKMAYVGAETLTWAFSSIKSKIYEYPQTSNTINQNPQGAGQESAISQPPQKTVQVNEQKTEADGWDADDWGADEKPVTQGTNILQGNDGWGDDDDDIWESMATQPPKQEPTKQSHTFPTKPTATPSPNPSTSTTTTNAPRLPSSGMTLGSKTHVQAQTPTLASVPSKAVADGWDDDSGFDDDDGWAPAKVPQSSVTPAKNETGLTKLELQQKKKEERMSKQSTVKKEGTAKTSLGAVRKVSSHDD